MDDAAGFGRALEADMKRLGERPCSEVGVPMFLMAEDLRAHHPGQAAPAAADAEVATLFSALAHALAERRHDIPYADVTRLVEVLADRHLLGNDALAYTRLCDPEAHR
jgi:hypothetical protein